MKRKYINLDFGKCSERGNYPEAVKMGRNYFGEDGWFVSIGVDYLGHSEVRFPIGWIPKIRKALGEMER